VAPEARSIRILGIRGVPAAHGGFETFAEHLALYLRDAGWRVTVYCQVDGRGPTYTDAWQGIERVNIPVATPGPRGTIIFDWKAVLHAGRSPGLCLTLGYNTAVFCAWLRLKGITNLINMDGIEWARAKWSGAAKAWFWLNDWAGCWLGNHLVADHPSIADHLATRVSRSKITMIPYGAVAVTSASEEPVRALGLEPGRYLTVIARAEPENSLLEIVQGFSKAPRGMHLAVLGHYDPNHAYQRAVMQAAGPEVKFLGAIYDKAVVQALRFHCAAYVHGHQVGGTNPSLVEALGAGNAVIAHDNRFNRWVAGEGAVYFRDAAGFDGLVQRLLGEPEQLVRMRDACLSRFQSRFTWAQVLAEYQSLLELSQREEVRSAARPSA
jgi:glycosyltransferase involved in cell wall biosynthesis